jgi:hypothetical protein
MSKNIDVRNAETLSLEDKQYLFDRGKLPSHLIDSFLSDVNTPIAPAQVAQPIVAPTPKTLEDMSKKDLLEEARKRGVKHQKNISYEKLLSLLEDAEDEDDEEEIDEDDEEDSDDEESDDDEEDED